MPTKKMLEDLGDTGYDSGELFETEDDVYDFFTVSNMRYMFGEENVDDWSQNYLIEMADHVVVNRLHMVNEITVKLVQTLPATTIDEAVDSFAKSLKLKRGEVVLLEAKDPVTGHWVVVEYRK